MKLNKDNYNTMPDGFHKAVTEALDEAYESSYAYKEQKRYKPIIVIAVFAVITAAVLAVFMGVKTKPIKLEPITDITVESITVPMITDPYRETTTLPEAPSTTEHLTTVPSESFHSRPQTTQNRSSDKPMDSSCTAFPADDNQPATSPEVTNINQPETTVAHFEEGVIIVRLNSTHSDIQRVHTPDEFPGVEIESIKDITYYDDTLLSLEEAPENFTQMIKITLVDKQESAVLKALDVLVHIGSVLNATPNYYSYATDSD